MSDDPLSIARILKTFVSDGDKIFPMDTIEYQNKLWLVPEWLEHTTEGWITPARIICMEALRVQDLRQMTVPADFSISAPIPKPVLAGGFPQAEDAKYLVVERPPIRFRRPPSVH